MRLLKCLVPLLVLLLVEGSPARWYLGRDPETSKSEVSIHSTGHIIQNGPVNIGMIGTLNRYPRAVAASPPLLAQSSSSAISSDGKGSTSSYASASANTNV